jgi:glycosyltransferase involved in cell wall biosynthesis
MENKFVKKKKIAIIAPSMRHLGGQSIQANRLIEAFKDDEEIELIFIPNDPETVFQNVKFLRTIFTSLKFWKLLFKNLRKADAVHIFSAAVSGYVIATLPPFFIAKLFGKKTILNYHSGELKHHIKTWKLTAKPTMKRFDKIVVPSLFLIDVFAEFELEAEAISNFIDTEKFVSRPRNPLRPVFLSNRNFEVHYNVGDVLRAFNLIQKQIPEARLIIAGSGSEESALKKLAEDLNLANVEFTGKIPNSEMPEIYDRADIYLNTSIVDNMPLSFIEAFACGLPIISYATGGISYLVEDEKTGILVAPQDFPAVADKAVWLLKNNDEAQKIIENAREEVGKYESATVREHWRRFFQSETPL